MATIFWLPSALIVTPPQAITSRSGPADGIIGGDCHVGNGNGDCGGNGGVFGYFDLQRCHHPKRTPHSFPLHQRQGRCWPDRNPSKDCTLSLPPLRSLARPVTECWDIVNTHCFWWTSRCEKPETISPPLLPLSLSSSFWLLTSSGSPARNIAMLWVSPGASWALDWSTRK